MEMGPNLDPDMFAASSASERALPPPVLCGKPGSSVDPELCSVALHCATSFEPRVGPGPLDLEQVQAAAKSGAAGKPSGGLTGWASALAPGEGDNTAACTGHLDQKFNVLGKEGAGWLTLRIAGVQHGVLVVCEGPFSARFKAQVGYLNTSATGGNAQMELDGQPRHYARKLSKSLCSVVADDLSPGDHTLALRPTAKHLTGFSHVIWA
jgi:hypothetical protein